jgi:hypothetical protein
VPAASLLQSLLQPPDGSGVRVCRALAVQKSVKKNAVTSKCLVDLFTLLANSEHADVKRVVQLAARLMREP